MNIFGNLMRGQSLSVISRHVGSFVFDVVTSESHQSDLRVTENPVESGAMVADHSILEPKSITIEAIMVGYEPPKSIQSLLPKEWAGRFDQLMNEVLPAEVKAVTQQTISMADRYIGELSNIYDNKMRPLAPWLPDYNPLKSDSSATVDRVAQAYEQLENIQRCGEPVDVQTGLRLYSNMMLTGMGITQIDDGSATFSLSFKEIYIVETEMGSGLVVAAPKNTKSTNQSSSKKQGVTNPSSSNNNKIGG